MSDNGLEKVPGIFISRLVQGGLAEMTGLLAVNDEVLEVNGIEVNGKSLDQVGTGTRRNISFCTRLNISVCTRRNIRLNQRFSNFI